LKFKIFNFKFTGRATLEINLQIPVPPLIKATAKAVGAGVKNSRNSGYLRYKAHWFV
jgi:hypothetical protein